MGLANAGMLERHAPSMGIAARVIVTMIHVVVTMDIVHLITNVNVAIANIIQCN